MDTKRKKINRSKKKCKGHLLDQHYRRRLYSAALGSLVTPDFPIHFQAAGRHPLQSEAITISILCSCPFRSCYFCSANVSLDH